MIREIYLNTSHGKINPEDKNLVELLESIRKVDGIKSVNFEYTALGDSKSLPRIIIEGTEYNFTVDVLSKITEEYSVIETKIQRKSK